ncbi:MAG: hypothetical protein L0027_12345 [Candidatus Rokubacteria bacterium]|nr:hypothetical protein [Candidatus Rokubacteria bacterium]
MARWAESQRETFEALRRAYLADVPARIAAIRQAAAALRGGAPQRALDELAAALETTWKEIAAARSGQPGG